MKNFTLRYNPYGESAILIEWTEEINEAILNDIRFFTDTIKAKKIDGLVDFNFVYNSLLINYDSLIISYDDFVLLLKEIYANRKPINKLETQIWYVPVCYDHDFGLDIDNLISAKGINEMELISLHTAPFYTVYGIGFLPGFLYLGGLSEQLIMPRKDNPRLDVPSGAVAIGGNQTGIYPQNSPGGWYIIGKTPIPLFNAKNKPPCDIAAGDRVKFYSISKREYENIDFDVKAGNYDLKKV